ncbi:uncharacterized protein LOC123501361 [Portunus trituberculatus]|uniref:uncharacterized protein LOC123501361 n=1 Tax=Portunus trituberculatus TaxID=210409 RepID=UPI001E1CB488|nr:uncharacterized protein LOC123501361 [Portunus trituberculatus]
MPSSCSVLWCYSDKGKTAGTGIRYFRFPKNDEIRKQWVRACDKVDDFNFKNAVVCSRHFMPSDYARDLKNEFLQTEVPRRKRSLKEEAVPSLFLTQDECSAQETTNNDVDDVGLIQDVSYVSCTSSSETRMEPLPDECSAQDTTGTDVGDNGLQQDVSYVSCTSSNDANLPLDVHIAAGFADTKNDCTSLKEGGSIEETRTWDRFGGFEGIVQESAIGISQLLEKRIENLEEENRQLREKCEALKANGSDSNKNVIQSTFETVLQPIFTKTQISALINKKKVKSWSEDDIGGAFIYSEKY